MRVFTEFNGCLDYSDSTAGFFSMLRDIFVTLGREEELACKWEDLDPVMYPSFGHADDDYEKVVRPFYNCWNGFATKKTFSWKDVYRYSEAPDRRVRRMMEKENKRVRDQGIHEFNDAVRSLVAFVKKRDIRYKPSKQTEAERQKTLRDAAAAQAARSRAANQAKLEGQVLPDWAKGALDSIDEDDIEGEAQDVQKQLECVLCKKTFKSEKQFDVHEKSKKHVKAAQHLRQNLQREDEFLALESLNLGVPAETEPNSGSDQSVSSHATPDEAELKKAAFESVRASKDELISMDNGVDLVFSPTDEEDEASQAVPTEPGDEHASHAKLENLIISGFAKETATTVLTRSVDVVDLLAHDLIFEPTNEDSELNTPSKLGKAKAKRARKAVRKAATETGKESEVSTSPVLLLCELMRTP